MAPTFDDRVIVEIVLTQPEIGRMNDPDHVAVLSLMVIQCLNLFTQEYSTCNPPSAILTSGWKFCCLSRSLLPLTPITV